MDVPKFVVGEPDTIRVPKLNQLSADVGEIDTALDLDGGDAHGATGALIDLDGGDAHG